MIEFRMPSLGSDMDEGKLLKWLVRPGDTVHKGQVIAVVDTSKAAIDVECWSEGVVRALLVEPEAVIAVGTLMAVLRAPGEPVEEVDAQVAAIHAAARGAASAPAPAVPPGAQALARGSAAAVAAGPSGARAARRDTEAAADASSSAERRRVSPVARRRAHELGVDVDSVRGSGPDGAVTLRDVETRAAHESPAGPDRPAAVASPVAATARAAPAAQAAASRTGEMRKVIAAAMARSKREIPHYYLAEDILFANAAAWLAQRNAALPVTQRLLPAALLIKSVAVAVHHYPEFNGFWRDGGFDAARGVHPGVAISLREGGLIAPALRDAAALDIAALTRALLDLVKRTRAGSLRSSELSEATITITNLGEQGVASVFGVIYPPQVALIGFGRVMLRPWAAEVGGGAEVKALPVLTASLAADHRASDGHRGALLLARVRELLQDPQALDAPLHTPQAP
jgi:pyruvate dehydrogenase E2 component (dihydrolipoamide acetyltransferase)